MSIEGPRHVIPGLDARGKCKKYRAGDFTKAAAAAGILILTKTHPSDEFAHYGCHVCTMTQLDFAHKTDDQATSSLIHRPLDPSMEVSPFEEVDLSKRYKLLAPLPKHWRVPSGEARRQARSDDYTREWGSEYESIGTIPKLATCHKFWGRHWGNPAAVDIMLRGKLTHILSFPDRIDKLCDLSLSPTAAASLAAVTADAADDIASPRRPPVGTSQSASTSTSTTSTTSKRAIIPLPVLPKEDRAERATVDDWKSAAKLAHRQLKEAREAAHVLPAYAEAATTAADAVMSALLIPPAVVHFPGLLDCLSAEVTAQTGWMSVRVDAGGVNGRVEHGPQSCFVVTVTNSLGIETAHDLAGAPLKARTWASLINKLVQFPASPRDSPIDWIAWAVQHIEWCKWAGCSGPGVKPCEGADPKRVELFRAVWNGWVTQMVTTCTAAFGPVAGMKPGEVKSSSHAMFERFMAGKLSIHILSYPPHLRPIAPTRTGDAAVVTPKAKQPAQASPAAALLRSLSGLGAGDVEAEADADEILIPSPVADSRPVETRKCNVCSKDFTSRIKEQAKCKECSQAKRADMLAQAKLVRVERAERASKGKPPDANAPSTPAPATPNPTRPSPAGGGATTALTAGVRSASTARTAKVGRTPSPGMPAKKLRLSGAATAGK
jgi:hypothetical protein